MMDEMQNLIGRPPTAKISTNSNVDHLASNSDEDDFIDNLYNDDDDQARSDDPSAITAAANRDNLADSATLPPETTVAASQPPLLPTIPIESGNASPYADTPAFNAPQQIAASSGSRSAELLPGTRDGQDPDFEAN